MKWIGLTGGIASGKTTVSNRLKELGMPVVDADHLAHQAFRICAPKIETYFGSDILDTAGNIDRKKLGARVFSNEKEKLALEAMLHPIVQEKVTEKKRLFEIADYSAAVYDVPLLFEKQLQSQFDHVLVVYAPVEISLERLMRRNNFTKEEALLRINNQIDIELKKSQADSVIKNTGDLDQLLAKVDSWYQSIME